MLLAVELLDELKSVVEREAHKGRSRRSDHIERQHWHKRIASSSSSHGTEVWPKRRCIDCLPGVRRQVFREHLAGAALVASLECGSP